MASIRVARALLGAALVWACDGRYATAMGTFTHPEGGSCSLTPASVNELVSRLAAELNAEVERAASRIETRLLDRLQGQHAQLCADFITALDTKQSGRLSKNGLAAAQTSQQNRMLAEGDEPCRVHDQISLAAPSPRLPSARGQPLEPAPARSRSPRERALLDA